MPSMIHTTISQFLNSSWKDLLQKKESWSTKMEPSIGPKLRKAFQKAGGRKFSDSDWLQKKLKIQTEPVYNFSEKVIPIEESKWNDIPACQQFRGNTLEAEVSKLVMRLVRRYHQHKRETDGAVYWKSMGSRLRKSFQKAGGRKFSDSDWLQLFYKGSNKTRCQCCKNSRDV